MTCSSHRGHVDSSDCLRDMVRLQNGQLLTGFGFQSESWLISGFKSSIRCASWRIKQSCINVVRQRRISALKNELHFHHRREVYNIQGQQARYMVTEAGWQHTKKSTRWCVGGQGWAAKNCSAWWRERKHFQERAAKRKDDSKGSPTTERLAAAGCNRNSLLITE